eukprot:2164981-Prymnesium_polylepis.1
MRRRSSFSGRWSTSSLRRSTIERNSPRLRTPSPLESACWNESTSIRSSASGCNASSGMLLRLSSWDTRRRTGSGSAAPSASGTTPRGSLGTAPAAGGEEAALAE